MGKLKDTITADAAKLEAAAKAEATKIESGTYSGKALLVAVSIAFVAGLLVHLV